MRDQLRNNNIIKLWVKSQFELKEDHRFAYRDCWLGSKLIVNYWHSPDFCMFFHESITKYEQKVICANATRADMDSKQNIEKISGLRFRWGGYLYHLNNKKHPPIMYRDVVITNNTYNIYEKDVCIAYIKPNKAQVDTYEINLWVHEDYRRRGYATQLIRACSSTEHAILFYLVAADNTPSIELIKNYDEASFVCAIIILGD